MSDEGYIAVKQGEDRNYGTVAMTEEEEEPSPPAASEAASTTQVESNELVLVRHAYLLRPNLYSTEGR